MRQQFAIVALIICVLHPCARLYAGDALARLDVRQVRVGGEIGRRIDSTIYNNLLVIDVDKVFLQPFRRPQEKEVYIGLGKFIDSLSRLAAYTSDDKVLALRRYVLDNLQSLQGPDGYIGIFPPDKRIKSLWDIHEISYLIYGLTSDAQLFDNKNALESARRLADYLVGQLQDHSELAPDPNFIAPHIVMTGLESALLALADQTGDMKYRDFVVNYRHLPEWDHPVRVGRYHLIANHAYSYLCRCIAQLRLYRTMQDDRLLTRSREVMDFLTKGNGMVITGAVGDHECWHNTQAGTINLGETCATAYLVRWLDEQLRLTGDIQLGDMMERTIFNTLFAAQSPDGRHIRYSTPFDGPRKYFHTDSYCCPCNFRRIIAELPQMIYYRSADGLLVNLYTPSTATFDLNGDAQLRIRQKTDYPSFGKVVIHIDPKKAGRFAVKLRIPRWCQQATATVEGKGAAETHKSAGGQLLAIEREWNPGDRIDLDLPMRLRFVKGRVNQAGRVAVMYGPTVFCLNPTLNPDVAKLDLRLIVALPTTLEGPTTDETVRPNGLSCSIKAWPPGAWYPAGAPELTCRLTEFADPGGTATYLFVPDPDDPVFVEDELIAR